MPNFAGYKNLEKIAESDQGVIYSAIRASDNKDVMIKTLRAEHPSMDAIVLMYHEYGIWKDLDYPGIIHLYEMIDQNDQYALILEDMDGVPLTEYLQTNPINDISLFLTLAMQMAKTLEYLHHHHIIHKDIKPANFIITPNSLTIKLTDFNCSTKLLHEMQDIVPPNTLEGTLTYMAPEQTGRMNMTIDYRADFYALGVSFYEMLMGQAAYLYQDPLELLHAHLALPAPTMSNAPFNIPTVIQEIVGKLMAKNPGDRYQSAQGLVEDLKKCQGLLESTGEIENFSPGEHDDPDRLNLSQKLYGREKEAEILLNTYDRVSTDTVEALMVCGYSGIGKTMLINEVHRPMVRDKGFFISGKFDQLQRDKPYTALTQALNHLAQLIMAEPEDRYNAIKQAMQEALGDVGQVIIDLAPDIEKIIGPQTPLEQASPLESRIRLETFFRAFLRAVANADHPLVIFIDDLQWIDGGSLNLLEAMMTDSALSYVLLIGAYRDNEVDEVHPLKLFFQTLQNHEKKLQFLPLGPLTAGNFAALFKDSFHRDEQTTQPFADLIHKRTDGNPFFCKQVVGQIYNKNLLFFNHDHHQWEWNLETIMDLGITDNVVDLMLSKLAELPEKTQELLKYASCIGNRFTIETLQLISAESEYDIAQALWFALQQDILISLHLGYKKMEGMKQKNVAKKLSKNIVYQFIHDRVQQAVYQSIPAEEKPKNHLKIARTLMEKDPAGSKNEHLFEIIDHFNEAHNLLSESEKKEVAQLNYQAALRAQNSIAWQQMLSYLLEAIDLVDEDAWQTNYTFMFDLHYCQLLALLLLNKTKEVDALTKNLLVQAQNNFDKARVCRLQSINYHEQNNIIKTRETALQALKLLGVELKLSPSKLQILFMFFVLRWKMRGKKIQVLEGKLKPLTDPTIILVFEIFSENFFVFYEKSLDAFIYMVLVAMSLQLQYGKPRSLGLWVTNYGILLLNIFKNASLSFEYWLAAKHAYEEIPDKFSSGPTYTFAGHFIVHYQCHFRMATALFERSLQDCRESGNVALGIQGICMPSFGLAAEAESIKKTIDTLEITYKAFIKRGYTDYAIAWEIVYVAYKILSDMETKLENHYDELLKKVLALKNIHIMSHSLRFVILYYYFNEAFDKTIDYHFQWQEQHVRFEIMTHEAKMLSALALIRAIPQLTGRKRKQYLNRFLKLLGELKWASDACAENYLHQYLFLQGAKAQLERNYYEAFIHYTQAVENAKNGSFYLWTALGYELLGDLFIEQNKYNGFQHIAINYFRHARYYYNRYGMLLKVKLLEKRYPECMENERRAFSLTDSVSQAGTTTPLNFDFLSVMKASQTISGEIVLEKLFEKMLRIVSENAGAERAVFLTKSGENWIELAALDNHEGQTNFQMRHHIMTEFNTIPLTVIQYALRSRNPVVLDDASVKGQFVKDPYIVNTKSKSILCLPLLYQDKVHDIIYLENNLTIGAFTEDSITVLTTLASQISISVENARLYHQATHDALTGLANRNLLYHEFNLALNKAKITHGSVAIMLFDLDYFKTINDTLGHQIGDQVLIHISKLITQCIGKGNLAVRLGGDEFVAMIECQDIKEATQAAETFLLKLKEPVKFGTHDLLLSSSIGISFYPHDGETISALLEKADVALYRVKAKGKNQFELYTISGHPH
jgi:diguanylate cyclase (GGDEF)-like protein